MLKTRSLLPVALLSTFVGLTGCHVSFSSGSGSKAPNSSAQGKPAKKSPSKAATPTNTGAKPINKRTADNSKSISEPAPAPAPATDKTDPGPKRTATSSDPKRVKPDEGPKRTNKHIGGGRAKQPVQTNVAETETDEPETVNATRPGSLTAPK